jgi:DNA-binding transcriptional MocR family regulator
MNGCASGEKADQEDWVSVKRLAAIRGVSHQAVSKRVAGFMARGLLEPRRVGKEKLVHLPTFDALAAASHDPAQDLRLRHAKGDPQRATGESIEDASAPNDDQGGLPAPLGRHGQSDYDAASTREKNAKAAMAEMELARRRGELVPVNELADAGVQVATTIAQHVAALKQISGKLYAASQAGGEDAVRLILLEEIDRVTEAIRDALLKLVNEYASEPQAPQPN